MMEKRGRHIAILAALLAAGATGCGSQSSSGPAVGPTIEGDAGVEAPADAGSAQAPAADAGAPAAAGPAPRPGWVPCAVEGDTCSFTGTKQVLYGLATDDQFFIKTLTDGTPCNSNIFGNPAADGWEMKYCWYKDMWTPPYSRSGSGAFVDVDAIPVPYPGFRNERREPEQGSPPTPQPPTEVGAFREPCGFSHMSFDDPIVFPGQPGLSHLHVFFGNTAAGASSTVDSIANSGDSTCYGGTLNRSSYWAPAVLDARTNAPVRPRSILTYYKSGYRGVPASAIQPIPSGLRMIAGDPGNATAAGAHAQYTCIAADGTSTPWSPSIPNCPVGNEMFMSVEFPQCWDGVNLDSNDHRSHMAFASNGCPADHPVAIPVISYNIHYPVKEANAPLHWRLSSDMYDPSLPGGYSGHADYFFGWKPDVMNTFIADCIQNSSDCHAQLLGDGSMLY
jgi:hypothetical protein